jgi:hypothetical protein
MDYDTLNYGHCEECKRELTEETTRECRRCSKLLCEWCMFGDYCEECNKDI